jgi:hypothetical protein
MIPNYKLEQRMAILYSDKKQILNTYEKVYIYNFICPFDGS